VNKNKLRTLTHNNVPLVKFLAEGSLPPDVADGKEQ